MDEPTSALDPKSTEAIEEMVVRLKGKQKIVLVIHNVGQAEKLCGSAALFEGGQVAGVGKPCEVLADAHC